MVPGFSPLVHHLAIQVWPLWETCLSAVYVAARSHAAAELGRRGRRRRSRRSSTDPDERLHASLAHVLQRPAKARSRASSPQAGRASSPPAGGDVGGGVVGGAVDSVPSQWALASSGVIDRVRWVTLPASPLGEVVVKGRYQ